MHAKLLLTIGWACYAASLSSHSCCMSQLIKLASVYVQLFAQVHATGQPPRKNSSSPLASSRWTWNRTDSGSISPDDKEKVYDAVIVAAGIVAVLIANVAYVGELCLPRSHEGVAVHAASVASCL